MKMGKGLQFDQMQSNMGMMFCEYFNTCCNGFSEERETVCDEKRGISEKD